MPSNKSSILHLINRHFPRGAETFAAQLSGALSARGHRNSLYSLYTSETKNFNVPKSVLSMSLEANQRSLIASLGLQPKLLFELIQIFHSTQPDTVIAHGGDTLKYAVTAGLFFPNILVIYRNIGTASFWAHNHLKILLHKLFLTRVNAIASVCEVSRTDFINTYGVSPEKVIVIPNGVDVSPFHAIHPDIERKRLCERLGISKDDTLLISVGNLSYEKNQSELLWLLSELKNKSVHLLLVGDGPLRSELEKQAETLDIKDQVFFLGLRNDVIFLLAASDIFLLPSKTEGMPAVLIEAGIAGLPSVAYDVGGVKEVTENYETGILVPAYDYKKFRSAVSYLLENPEKRQNFGIQASKTYPSRFDISVIARKYEELIAKCIQRRK